MNQLWNGCQNLLTISIGTTLAQETACYLTEPTHYLNQTALSQSAGTTITVSKSQIAKFMWPTWGLPWSCRPQMGPMLAPWTLLSGMSVVRVVQGGCQLQKQRKFPHALWHEHGNPNLYLEQLIILGWCQQGHLTYPTDRPTATRLGLCSSLTTCYIPHWLPYYHQARAVWQSDNMSHTPLTALLPPGWGCVTVCQHVTYPTDRPTATRLGLCNSLSTCHIPHWPPYCHQARAV